MEDLESNDIIEAYNRLSLLLDQQSNNDNQKHSIHDGKDEENLIDLLQPDNDNKIPIIIENKIDILADLIAKEELVPENKFQPLYESVNYNSSHHGSYNSGSDVKSNHEIAYNSKNVLPHMDELITVLVNNKIVKPELNENEEVDETHLNTFNGKSEKMYMARKDKKKINVHSFKKTKFDAFAIYKKANPKEINRTIERFIELEKHKFEKINSLKKELEENELRHIKNPEINQESHVLAGQRSKPLHLRTKEILIARKEKQNILKDQLHKEKELKDPTPNHKPNLELTQERSYSSARKNRNPKEFIKDIDNWYKKRNEKIQMWQMDNLKEDFKSMPFHPKINKKWKNLTTLDDHQNIEERLLEVGKNYKEREKKLALSTTPTFTPKINKNSLKIIEKLTEKGGNQQKNGDYSSERKPRASFLENTISFSTKGNEKFQRSTDEKDMRHRTSNNEESFYAKSSNKKQKINLVEYNESNKFVIESLKTKKQPKIMLKIN